MQRRELDEQADRAAVRWVIIGISVALVLYFALHPTYVLERWTGQNWIAFENHPSWVWHLPEITPGWRFRADVASAIIYSLVTCTIAAAALFGLAFFGLGPRGMPKASKP